MIAIRPEAIRNVPSAQRAPSPRGGEGRGEGALTYQNILANLCHVARRANLGAVVVKKARIVLSGRRPLTPTLSPTGRGRALCRRRLSDRSGHDGDSFAGRREAIKGPPSAQSTPSPRGGEGRGEGAPTLSEHSPELASCRSAREPWGGRSQKSSYCSERAAPPHPDPLPHGEREGVVQATTF